LFRAASLGFGEPFSEFVEFLSLFFLAAGELEPAAADNCFDVFRPMK
jgi:hypothetical protein